MTLREQIVSIHAKHFNKEFHEYRQNVIPAMLNDLAMKFFDSMAHSHEMATGWEDPRTPNYYYLPDSQDLRAVIYARDLLSRMEIRENTPGVE